MKKIEGGFSAQGLKVAIVASRFNEFITEKLIGGAVDCLTRNGCAENDITLVRVPGAFEIPPATRLTAESGKYDAVICLGAVIRGSTPHFDYVASEATKGIAQVSMQVKIPVIFGVLTTDNIEQAVERAGTKSGNKGFDAAMSAIEMCNLFKQMKG